MTHERAVAEAFLDCNGVWPIQLTSGVLFWMGQKVTLRDFVDYRTRVGTHTPTRANGG
jgi:hypothetical protein